MPDSPAGKSKYWSTSTFTRSIAALPLLPLIAPIRQRHFRYRKNQTDCPHINIVEVRVTPLEILEAATKEQLSDRDGAPASVTLLPPPTSDQLEALQRSKEHRIPTELRELLNVTSGFEFTPVGRVDLLGRDMPVETFFSTVPVLGDDAGNFWVLDLEGGAEGPAAVIFWCHDPPVAVMQAPTVGAFFQQIFALGRPPHDDALTFVKQTCARRIWAKDQFLIPAAQALDSADEELSRFAQSLPSSYHVADLRSRELGIGFSWGQSASDMRRAGGALIFGVERVGWLKRLLG